MSCLRCSVILLSVQESSAASHKCRFRVRHFGRVFALPYKYSWASRRIINIMLLAISQAKLVQTVVIRHRLTDDYEFELKGNGSITSSPTTIGCEVRLAY